MPVQTMRALKTAFYRATMTALGYDPDKAYKKIKPPVRMTYPPLGNPDWTMEEDVVFITIMDANGDDVSQPIHELWKCFVGINHVTHHVVINTGIHAQQSKSIQQ